MAYELIALLTDEADVSIERLARTLREIFLPDQGTEVVLEEAPAGQSRWAEVRWGDWSFRLAYEDAPHVREESQEMADTFAAGRADRGLIAGCHRRITMRADDDPGMDHFNDYCFIMDHLGRLKGVILFDPKVPEFVED